MVIGFFWIVRALGVLMALAMIAGAVIPEFPVDGGGVRRPAAQTFITSAPNAFLLFAPFIVPYSKIENRFAWAICWGALVVAAVVLVVAGLRVFSSYYVGEAGDRGEALVLISLSVCVSALSPVVVLARRRWAQ